MFSELFIREHYLLLLFRYIIVLLYVHKMIHHELSLCLFILFIYTLVGIRLDVIKDRFPSLPQRLVEWC